MAKLIGDQSVTYSTEIALDRFYPILKLADFQQLFGFLKNTSEYSIANVMLVQQQIVHSQLKELKEQYTDLQAVSQAKFGNGQTGVALYTQAVFSLTAANLTESQMATDATKQAADRQEALVSKSNMLRTQYRDAIDQLIGSTGYTVELV